DRSPRELMNSNYVVINPSEDFYPIHLGKKTAIQSSIVFNHNSSLLKHIRPTDFHIWQGRPIEGHKEESDFFRAIISAAGIPLLAEWSKGKKHLLVLGFNPNWLDSSGDTDWALSPAFPIFWTNLINYLVPESKTGQQKDFCYYQTGLPCQVNLGPPDKPQQAVTFRQPDGTVLTVQTPGDEFTFIPTQVGIHTITRGYKKKLLAVNLARAEMFNQVGQTRLLPTPPHSKKETGTVKKTSSLISYLVALGLILFLFTWWIEKSERG
ncbi:unnamed protein product, partial [marine sediment metagenome]